MAFSGGYEVMEELPGGAFHARSEADLEVRLSPRLSPMPVPTLLAPHPHVAEVLAVRDELVVSAWVPGVSLRELVARASRRGLPTLPPYLSVMLLQQVCRGLHHAHANHGYVPGEVSLDGVVMGFDGCVRVTSFGAPERDVPAAALVLDQLLGETLDAELVRIIGEAREPEATRRVPTAISLEQRLGHWQVKQRQLFPQLDLVAEFVAWLYPEEAKRVVSEDVAAWLRHECTGPVTPEPAPARPPKLIDRAQRRRSRIRVLSTITVLLALFIVAARTALMNDLPDGAVVPHAARAIESRDTPVRGVIAAHPTMDPGPTLPRRGTGAPSVVLLSSRVHGVELETSGFAVRAPAPRWAVRTISRHANQPAPAYASLFVAEFDGSNQLQRLGQVGPSWLTLSQPSARFFAMQTDQPADQDSFGLSFATIEGTVISPHSASPDVLTDSMTFLEYRRFVLDGLDPKLSYQVTQQPNPQGANPPVIVTATIPRRANRTMLHAGFQTKGDPLDQVMLKPSTPVVVKDASRLSFVVLTTKDAPELTTSIEVNRTGLKGQQPSVAESVEALLIDARGLMNRRDYSNAATVLGRCVEIAPTNVECNQLLSTAMANMKKRPR